jgi:hypothetical protein
MAEIKNILDSHSRYKNTIAELILQTYSLYT